MTRRISSASSIEALKREARRWLKAVRTDAAGARERLLRVYPAAGNQPVLRDVQHALAREYGFNGWTELMNAVAALAAGSASRPRPPEDYARLAADYVAAFDDRDPQALERLNAYYRRTFTFDDQAAEIWDRVYAFRERSSRVARNYLLPAEAQLIVAQNEGFGSWSALIDAHATGAQPVPAFAVDLEESRLAPRRHLRPDEWETLAAVVEEHGLTAIEASGLMTDEALARLAGLQTVTTLRLGGCRGVTDAGVRHLVRMPQLRHLELTGTKVTDAGLEVLHHLPALQRFEMAWNRTISDAGVSHLRACEQLEDVNLMGSAVGDGAIAALRGMPLLRSVRTGRLVTDAGLALLREFPTLAKQAGGDVDGAAGVRLLIDGPFTDRGLASLAGLDGVADLDLFWHVTQITSDGFAHLARLPSLTALGADGRLSDDRALAHIAAIPRLRRLRIQEAVASEAGFEALSRSASLESIWGRDCPNFASRAFAALSQMPALRDLGIGLSRVEPQSLALLPQFPALRELTPIGLEDDGFEHVGRCARLTRLTCMYCRASGDAATAHVRALPLEHYYAGLTQITDRSLEALGRMTTLEQVEIYDCQQVSDAGLPFLAALPNLREVSLDHLPRVTFRGTHVFPSRVRVRYST